MPVEKWSDSIVVVHLADDPQFTEDLECLERVVPKTTGSVIDFSGVRFINSSNIARLLKVRKMVISRDGRLVLCGVNDQIWGAFLVTGLDKVFEFSDNVPTGLATLQMG